MKTSIATILVAAGVALATSASAHSFNRSTAGMTASHVAGTSVEQNRAQGGQGRIILAASGSSTGGPSGGPSQNGG